MGRLENHKCCRQHTNCPDRTPPPIQRSLVRALQRRPDVQADQVPLHLQVQVHRGSQRRHLRRLPDQLQRDDQRHPGILGLVPGSPHQVSFQSDSFLSVFASQMALQRIHQDTSLLSQLYTDFQIHG